MTTVPPIPAASVFLFCSAAFCAALLAYALRQRRDTFTLNFVALMAISTAYALGYGAELMSSDLNGMKTMLRIQYLGIPFISVAWLGLAWAYLDSRGLPRRLLIALLVFPCVVFAGFQTNDLHHLFYAELTYSLIDGMVIARSIKGPLYWLHIIYLNLAIAAGAALFFRAWRQSIRIYHWQALFLLIGSFFPWLFHLIYLAGLSPYRIDLGPFGLAAAGLCFAIASFRHGVFEILPVARDLVFDGLSEGVIVIDDREHIVDFNRAASNFIAGLDLGAIGRRLDEIAGGDAIAKQLAASKESRANTQNIHTEIVLLHEGERRHFEVRLSPMKDRKGNMQCQALLMLDITEKKRLIEQLHHQASVDPLTGVYNRRQLVEQASHALLFAQRNQSPLSVCIVDVDHFKDINDRRGHGAGDKTLQNIVSAFRSRLRASDIFGRFGGDEFVIVLPSTNIPAAAKLMEELNAICRTDCGVTLSIGIAEAHRDTPDFDHLLQQADEQLYLAKDAGRNRICATDAEHGNAAAQEEARQKPHELSS